MNDHDTRTAGLRNLRRIRELWTTRDPPAHSTDQDAARALAAGPPPTPLTQVPRWCYPGERVYASTVCRAWSTRDDTPVTSAIWLDHGEGTLYLTDLQTIVFLQSPGQALCVPHRMVAETGVYHSDLEIAMTVGSLLRLHLDRPHVHRTLLDHLRWSPRTPPTFEDPPLL